MIINKDKSFCFRITHRDNLVHILTNGIVNKYHKKNDGAFVSIGNPEIIDVRSSTRVNLNDYGCVGEYVPFYFTPRSIMLYNIVTGYQAPKVRLRSKDEIIVIRCLIAKLAEQPKWFFTDGQANDGESIHYNDLKYLNKIDWNCIQKSDFSKTDGDYDRQRRYQAEFLVHEFVPVLSIESICVYNEQMKESTEDILTAMDLKIPVYIYKNYFFD